LQTTAVKKFDALTGSRFLFASFVFIYHNRKYWRKDLNKYVLQFFNELHVGVSLFFVLSGFLIAYKYNDRQQMQRFQYGDYISLRLARIFPLYWLIILVSYIDWGFPSPYKTFISFTLLHGFSAIHNLEGISQAWSLTVEMSFYLLAPLLFILLNKKVWKAFLLLLLLFIAVWIIGAAWHKINCNKKEYLFPLDFLVHSTFFGRFPEFMAGVLFAGILHRDYKDPFIKCKYKTSIGFLGLFTSIFIISFFQPDIFHHGNDTVVGTILQYTLVPFFAVLWMYGLITEHTWMRLALSNKMTVLLGNASFAFYLIHISYVNLRLKEWKLFPDHNFVLLWLISIVLYLLFEKPVNDLLRKMLFRTKKKLIAVPQPVTIETLKRP
jgi:peptidoglycan/LPS O-acetylase OafA/YrhL